MTSFYRAAWVPDDNAERAWEEGAALAADWIRSQAAALNGQPLLVTHSFDNGAGVEAFRGLQHVTTRSRGSVTGPVGRPVLTYVPDERVMALAHRYARKSALCAVETAAFPLHGWARESGAVNLLTDEVLPELDATVTELLGQLKFIGNNGWGDQYGKRDANRLLPELRQHIDRAEVLGCMLGRGATDNGVGNLQKIMDKLQWSE